MTVRRQLINLEHKSIELRLGLGAFDELSRYFRGVVSVPKRSVLVADAASRATHGEVVERSLIDAGYAVTIVELSEGEPVRSLDAAKTVFDALSEAAITKDDLVVALGGADVCSLVSWCARNWCAGTPAALLPTTFDAMITSALDMQPIEASGAQALALDPEPELVVCDLDLVRSAMPTDLELGYVEALASMAADSRKAWDDFGRIVPGLLKGEEIALINAVAWSVSARLDVHRAPSPSAREALGFGRTFAAALGSLVSEDVPQSALLAEGIRFEARLAFDACDFDLDDVYAIDDCLADLGVDELACEVSAEELVAAVGRIQLARGNKRMFSLPHAFGAIRLVHVDDEVLARHARAFAESRADI